MLRKYRKGTVTCSSKSTYSFKDDIDVLSEQHPEDEEDSDADPKAGFCPSIVADSEEISSDSDTIDLENEKFACFEEEIPWSSSASQCEYSLPHFKPNKNQH